MTDSVKIEKLLDTQKIIVLAVSQDDQPWAVPVAMREHDGVNSFLWDSALTTRHSKILEQNPHASLTIFSSQPMVGLCLEGTVELTEEFKPGFGRYRFTTQHAWLNDETFVKRPLDLV